MDTVDDILRLWTAAELLSPQEAPHPKDGKKERLCLIERVGDLPWTKKQPDDGKRRRHIVCLGLSGIQEIVDLLRDKFGKDDQQDATKSRKLAALACFVIDEDGLPVLDSFKVASHSWAIGQMLAGQNLDGFPKFEQDLSDVFNTSASAAREKGTVFSFDDLGRTLNWILKRIAWTPKTLQTSPAITETLWVSKNARDEDLAKTDLLNSFLLEDLERLSVDIKSGNYGEALARYLRLRPLEPPVDVRRNPTRLKSALHPASAPTGRWPSKGLHQLAMMQQAAVNGILAGVEGGTPPTGLFSVNGPPGTGKTTLLRDVIAGLMIERARRMCQFVRPEDAFSPAMAQVTVGEKDWPVYPLDKSLLGFEIVVASSNNNAVENVTAEIPALDAVEPSALGDLDLFQTVASDLLGGPDDDGRERAWGLMSAVLGNSTNRSAFANTIWFSKDEERPSFQKQLEDAAHADVMGAWRTAKDAFSAADADLQVRRAKLDDLEQAWLASPSWIEWLLTKLLSLIFGRSEEGDVARKRKRIDQRFGGLLTELGAHFPYEEFDRLPPAERALIQPWITTEHDRMRADLFVKAMAVHKAFIEASGKRFVTNFRQCINLLRGALDPGHAAGQAVRKGETALQHLWATLFLATPVISTTFASASRLFAGVGKEELGWLLVDEAGQATPQSAAGLIWRSRRVAIVGDPLQIEPVVTLPKGVFRALRQDFNVSSDWCPSVHSVQTLADRVNPFGTAIRVDAEDIWVGCPLEVHRRCIQPMFSVSNRIAYDGLMVQATKETPSPVGRILGKTRWIDVRGDVANGHWIPEEGNIVQALLGEAIRGNLGHPPDLFVISPFKTVAEGMKRHLRSDHVGWSTAALKGWLHSNIGTIHTFQGREADAVILLLGGDPAKKGARDWASGKPNILNVAVTRAKRRLYIVGNHAHWKAAGHFETLAANVTEVERPQAAVNRTARHG